MNMQCRRCLSSVFPKTNDGCTFCTGREPVKTGRGYHRLVTFNDTRPQPLVLKLISSGPNAGRVRK